MGTETEPIPASRPIRVGLLMAYPMGAELLAVAFDAERDISVVCATSDIGAFLPFLTRFSVDVAVVDFQLAGGRAFEALKHPAIRNGRVRALALSATTTPDHVASVRAGGAMGFVPKAGCVADMTSAIRALHQGHTTFPKHIPPRAPLSPPPSRREFQLLQALRFGASNAEIAHSLDISVRTVESHLRRLFARYGTSSRAELLMLALRLGWVQLDPPPSTLDTPTGLRPKR